MVNDDDRPSKRGVLSIVTWFFCPIGFAAHVLVSGEMILRDVWGSGTAWDEEIFHYDREMENLAVNGLTAPESVHAEMIKPRT